MSRSWYSISAYLNIFNACSPTTCMQNISVSLCNLATNQQLLVWGCVLNPLSLKTFVQLVLEILSYHVFSFPRKDPCKVTVNATYGKTSILTCQSCFYKCCNDKNYYYFQLKWGNRTPGDVYATENMQVLHKNKSQFIYINTAMFVHVQFNPKKRRQ